jgi:hypothetical protein
MAKHSYKITSQEGADRYKAELGDTAELDINDEEKLAVIAAGWLEHVTAAKPAKEEKNRGY